MNFNANETLYHSITKVNETTYEVCYDTPPRTDSDGLWGSHKNGRTPMRSFLPMFELQVLIVFVITQICRLILKPLGLPIFISQMMAGIILGALLQHEPLNTYMKVLFPYGTHDIISTISSIGLVLFIFIYGVQMDFSMITRTGKKAWGISIIGLLVPLLFGVVPPILFPEKLYYLKKNDYSVALVSHTINSFAVIASLLNELKIQNSELGRLALTSALVSDVLGTTIASICVAIRYTPDDTKVISQNLYSFFAFAILVPFLSRPAMLWIIKRTSEGRPVKEGYIYIIISMVFGLGVLSVKIHQEFVLGAFILGLSVPEGAPLGSALVKKLQVLGTSLLLPIFVTTSMLKADFSMDYSSTQVVITGLIVFSTHLVKIIACLLSALYCKMAISDALSLALILNTKGVVEVGLYHVLYDSNVIDGKIYGIMMISIMIIASIVQCSLKFLYDPSRKYAGFQKRSIMSLKQNSDLRMLVTIHRQNHISSMMDFLDLCCPTMENPITVDVLHLIELVGRALPVFIPHSLQRQTSSSRKSYSDAVILAFNIYEHDNLHAASVFTYTAISPPYLMHEDVCQLALDKVASMIILPFYMRWSIDGRVEFNDKNIRTLNHKVLDIAPCSVGILVTRGSQPIRDSEFTRLAIIYLGESDDDQEVLCLAKQAIGNPRISIVIYHLVVKDCIAKLGDLMVMEDDMLQEMKHAKNVKYQEIFTESGSETASFLSEIVNEHDFFMVGRRHGIDSPQTEGLTNWSEFPELGIVGDFLSSPDFRSRASVLVVQQQFSSKTRHGWIL